MACSSHFSRKLGQLAPSFRRSVSSAGGRKRASLSPHLPSLNKMRARSAGNQTELKELYYNVHTLQTHAGHSIRLHRSLFDCWRNAFQIQQSVLKGARQSWALPAITHL